MTTSTEATAQVARTYFDVWTNNKGFEALSPLLAESFTVRAGDIYKNRDQVLSSDLWPATAVARLDAEAYDGEHAFMLYTASNGGHEVRMVEHLIIRSGLIMSSEAILDRGEFALFMASGPPRVAP